MHSKNVVFLAFLSAAACASANNNDFRLEHRNLKSSKVPKATKSPDTTTKAPKAAKAPGAPKELKAPKATKAPKTAEHWLKSSKVPKATKSPDTTTKAPKATKAPGAPKDTKAPKATKAPDAPKEPKAPKATKAPGAPTHIVYLFPGDSIQGALDNAPEDGNTIIMLSPGDYIEEGNSVYGLRITKHNIKLIAIGESNNTTTPTRILHYGSQKVGVYAAPEGCEFKDNECDKSLSNFSIEGIVVEGFPANGIQTRFVDGFSFRDCKSVRNLNNGLYPTLSMNGRIEGCISYGSLDAGLWVAGSTQVQVQDNEFFDSVTGLEVTVSKDLYIANNYVHDNVVGVGMYHANMAGTAPNSPPYDNWIFENNRIYNNNRENNAPEGSFQSYLPSGVGIIMIGIRGQTVRNNIVEANHVAGLTMAGFCSVQGFFFQVDCEGPNAPIDGDPSANDNIIINNLFNQNGGNGLPDLGIPGKDIIYIQSSDEFLQQPNDNCFKNNTSLDGKEASSFATDYVSQFISLPNGGCAIN